jgi:hypothetical protein
MNAYGEPWGQQAEHGKGGMPMPTSDERMWAMFAHLSPLLLGVFGPLIIWLVKKDESQFVGENAKEALNFSLSVMIASLVLLITCVGPMFVGIAALVFSILAGMEANKGVYYRYPYTFRMIQ